MHKQNTYKVFYMVDDGQWDFWEAFATLDDAYNYIAEEVEAGSDSNCFEVHYGKKRISYVNG